MTEEPPQRIAFPTRRKRVLSVVAVLLAAGGILAGLAIAGRDGSSPSRTSTSAPLANLNAACSTWMAAAGTASSASTAWCGEMTAWMDQRVTNGQTTGMMMWGDPNQMQSSCHSWVQTGAAGVPSTSWCVDMVTWMRQHMNGDWQDWVMRGSMMGR